MQRPRNRLTKGQLLMVDDMRQLTTAASIRDKALVLILLEFGRIDNHPFRNDPNAHVWITKATNSHYEQITYNGARWLLKEYAARAGLKKRIISLGILLLGGLCNVSIVS